jgi:hypothetical protein
MRGHRLTYARYDTADEILVDFVSLEDTSEFLVWTDTADRIRIDVGGGWLTVGSSRSTAADLGAFTAGQTKQGKVEVTIPAGSGSRHEELRLNIGLGM